MSKHAMHLAARELPLPDPTQPTADVVIDGEIYRLCFDLLSLAEAEEYLIQQGHRVCLLLQMPPLTINTTFVAFTAAARKYQPWLTYEDVVELFKEHRESLMPAADAIHAAWNKSAAPKEEPVEGAPATEPNPPDPS